MRFQPGQSGNPKGRPPKDRALTALLEMAGAKSVILDNGEKVTPKRYVASLVWQALMTGNVALPDGKAIKLGGKDWVELVKFLYNHVDGPPKQNVDIRLSIEQEARRLAEEFGLDEAEVITEALAILKEAKA